MGVSLRGRLVRGYIGHKVKKSGKDLRRNYTTPPPSPPWRAPKGFTQQVVACGGGKLELLRAEGGNPTRALLQVHGGGFVKPLDNSHRKNSLWYARHTGCGLVAAPDYRTAPRHPFPAACDDVYAAWRALLALGYAPESIALAGDSAGGNLALALCLRLRDEGEALPCCVCLCSPWLDLACGGDSYLYNALRDPIYGYHGVLPPEGEMRLVPTPYAGAAEKHLPAASPLHGEFAGLPPMLLQAGSHEVLLSDSLRAHSKAQAAGVECTLAVYEGMFHGFQYSYGLVPESRAAWQETGGFVRKHITGG